MLNKIIKLVINLGLFLVGFFIAFALYKGRELEIEQLRRDNEILRQYIITLEEKVTLLEGYPYEHSEIKKQTPNDKFKFAPDIN
jgi:hypothetical protein